jgi:NADH/NAD ratio-sensing transcriptional regulator Rex
MASFIAGGVDERDRPRTRGVADSITAYLGNAGKKDFSGSITDVRSVLALVVDLAAELNVAVVGIMQLRRI